MAGRKGILNGELDEIWREYGETRSQGSRDVLVGHYHQSLVVPNASRIALRIFRGSIFDEDDLVQAGDLGLLDAMPRYDPNRNIKFETYGGKRVLGEMFQLLRRKSAEPAPALEEKDFPINEEEPQSRILRDDVRKFLLDELPARECLVTSLYFFLGFSAVDIAEITGLKPYEVVNLKASAVNKIRRNPRYTRQELVYLLAG